jgi:hypothetical protein
MKAAIAPLVASLLFSLCGCQTAKQSANAVSVAPQDDTSEILIQHLVRRERDLAGEIGKLENEILEHDNKCLQEQIAALEGHPIRHAKKDPVASAVASAHALDESLNAGLSRVAQNVLDGEAAIEEHNRKHPESPWADSKELLRSICGDCTKERAARDLQLKEEAPKHAPVKSAN